MDASVLKYVVAPMVEHSELAYRMMMRNNGATLCYTPMINARTFYNESTYRETKLDFHDDDHPVIVQFAANTTDNFMMCAKYVENMCEGVDLNLGCPQGIARRGNYGVFLQNDWQLISDMIKTVSSSITIPVYAKIRIFSSESRTVEYARMLENSGCSLISVHGRTSEQHGQRTGLANWEMIKLVKSSVAIPVLSNGNILFYEDIQRCLDFTKCDGVMVAETCLYNPYIFSNLQNSPFTAALDYLSYASKYNAPVHTQRSHLFKILYHVFEQFPTYRQNLANCKNIDDTTNLVKTLKEQALSCGILEDSFFCQPYIRKNLIETV